MPKSLDLRCYFVTGQPTADVARVAAEAAAGGAGVIQVRSKPIAKADLERLACEVADAVAAANPRTRVLIDDNVPLAAASCAPTTSTARTSARTTWTRAPRANCSGRTRSSD